ncbi:ArsR/SmtB family transcription factor [Abyssisolibacter fermentans]|uniref:ArsR/SmtB family transcription factor n=1 Tax=Abyssisolibacter fermentans TaxID=1766203 RepID=UPI00083716B0|nr:metalloregulator ArsR/SmtB family transcription factor [Abyssisolibacter fermentans]
MDELNKFFKMLSDQNRLRIMIVLYYQELFVCEICGILELSQPKVSKHLTKLRDMGFVKDCRKEQFVSYRLNLQDPVLSSIIEKIAQNIENYPQLKKDVEKIKLKNMYLNSCKCENSTNENLGKN